MRGAAWIRYGGMDSTRGCATWLGAENYTVKCWGDAIFYDLRARNAVCARGTPRARRARQIHAMTSVRMQPDAVEGDCCPACSQAQWPPLARATSTPNTFFDIHQRGAYARRHRAALETTAVLLSRATRPALCAPRIVRRSACENRRACVRNNAIARRDTPTYLYTPQRLLQQ